MARVTLVGSSHVRRLRDAIHTKSDHVFLEDFGISQAKASFVCKGGWTICDVHNETKRVAEAHPDYLILVIGSNDIVQLAHHLCLTSGAKGAVICSLMKRKLGRYLSTPCEVDRYNKRVVMANEFLTEVVPGEDNLMFWRQRGLLGPIGQLLCRDGTHLNAGGQYRLYKSIRGALIHAAALAGYPPPGRVSFPK